MYLHIYISGRLAKDDVSFAFPRAALPQFIVLTTYSFSFEGKPGRYSLTLIDSPAS